MIWSPNQDNVAIWDEVRAKLNDLVLVAFENHVSQRDDEVKKSESQRQMPGWSFCNFFLLKVIAFCSHERLSHSKYRLFRRA